MYFVICTVYWQTLLCLLYYTYVLTKNLVTEAIDWDQKDNLDKAPSKRTCTHLDSLKVAINSCGVCFNVWEKRNADGKGSGCFDFTSLMGSDKKILLQNLPIKLDGVVKPGTKDTVISMWKVPVRFLCIISVHLLILWPCSFFVCFFVFYYSTLMSFTECWMKTNLPMN